MPKYTFRQGKKTWTEWLSISERDAFMAANPDVEQQPTSPRIVRGVGQFGYKRKPDDAFRDILKRVKKGNPRSKIDTY